MALFITISYGFDNDKEKGINYAKNSFSPDLVQAKNQQLFRESRLLDHRSLSRTLKPHVQFAILI